MSIDAVTKRDKNGLTRKDNFGALAFAVMFTGLVLSFPAMANRADAARQRARAPAIQKATDTLHRLPVEQQVYFVDAGRAEVTCTDQGTGKQSTTDLPPGGPKRGEIMNRLNVGTCRVTLPNP